MILAGDAVRQPVNVDELEKHVEYPQRRNLAHLSPFRASSKHGEEILAILEEICGSENDASTVSLALSLTKMLIFSSQKLRDESLKKTRQRER